MKGIIYEYRNVFNNKFYVGQTKYPEKRYNNHKKAKEDSVFHFAIRKYGFESFEYNVVVEYEAETEEQLNDLLNSAEVERIKYRNSLVPNGYNVAEGGNVGNFLAGFTDEQRAEFCKTQSINSRRYWETLDDDERQKQLQLLKEAGLIGAKHTWTNKKHHSDETRKEMSNARKGKYTGENNPMYGKHHSDAAKKKISEKISGANNPNYGKHCYNNGINENMFFEGEQPEGWVIGGLKGEKSPMYGKHQSDAAKKKISEKNSGSNNSNYGKHWYNNGIDENKYFENEQPEGWVIGRLKGEKSPNYGKHHSDATKKKIGDKNRGRIHTDEQNKKVSDALKKRFEDQDFRKAHRERSIGKNNGMYGKTHSNKSRAKMSKAAQGKHRVYHEDGTYHMER